MLTKGLSNNDRVRGQPQHFSTVFGYEDNWNGSRGADYANRAHATSPSDPLVGRDKVGAALLGSPDCILLPIDNVERSVSDTDLSWMLDAATEVGLQYDADVLRLYPDAIAMQHDESRSSIFRFAKRKVRAPMREAPLHPTVLERFKADAVLQYDEMKPYRPPGLRHHLKVSHYYPAE